MGSAGADEAGADEAAMDEADDMKRGGDESGSPEPRSAKGKKRRKRGLKDRVAELEEALEKAEREAAENYDRLLRARAEYDNLRKRTRREIEQIHQRAGEDLVMQLLPALDNLEKAIEACRESSELQPMEEGLLMIRKGLVDALEAGGVSAVDPLGDRFDPNFHEAMMTSRTDEAEPGTVIRVLQKGYLMNGVTLRPAKVVVADALGEQEAEGTEPAEPRTNEDETGDRGGREAPSSKEV